jgi:hypothetical protein
VGHVGAAAAAQSVLQGGQLCFFFKNYVTLKLILSIETVAYVSEFK